VDRPDAAVSLLERLSIRSDHRSRFGLHGALRETGARRVGVSLLAQKRHRPHLAGGALPSYLAPPV